MRTQNDNHKYNDIIHLPHHVSSTHPRMSNHDRAAQFSPFAALTGYSGVIQEVGRLTDRKIELGESEIAELNRKLNQLSALEKKRPEVSITYFQPDQKKEGGSYVTMTGHLKRIDEYNRLVILTDGTQIPIGDMSTIEFEPPHN